ncbi:META domain-containing protein [Aquimarina algiphila]|uniref:META domain-containing protein n=1 Tax=Aquimarina algiphila TaxID=2047982 RepID=UPI0024927997|nr:META domain-containing protein [Aquimarina algiphila]
MKYLVIILFSLLFSNTNTCNEKKKIANHQEEEESQTDQEITFLIATLNGNNISNKKLYITFDEKRNSATGNSGCNTFSSKYTIDKEDISFGYPIATKMYCEENAKLEQEFFKTLIQSKVRIITEDSLFLKDETKKILFSGIKKPKE